jgi:hypothetical protein
METYRNNLEHVVQPSDPRERLSHYATRIELADWEALWLREQLIDHAHYHTDDQGKGICIAWVEYIDNKVRAKENTIVWLYAHTDKARTVLRNMLTGIVGTVDAELAEKILSRLGE